jgi:hypothetical protein
MGVATVLYFFTPPDREVTRWQGMPLVLFCVPSPGMPSLVFELSPGRL